MISLSNYPIGTVFTTVNGRKVTLTRSYSLGLIKGYDMVDDIGLVWEYYDNGSCPGVPYNNVEDPPYSFIND